MEVIYHTQFLKMYEKIPNKVEKKFEVCIDIFHDDPFDWRLRNHPLQGKWNGFRSIDITGDWRAVYLPINHSVARFYAIGTHSQLYG